MESSRASSSRSSSLRDEFSLREHEDHGQGLGPPAPYSAICSVRFHRNACSIPADSRRRPRTFDAGNDLGGRPSSSSTSSPTRPAIPSRLNRQGGSFGEEAYAASEELTAEIGAALLCQRAGYRSARTRGAIERLHRRLAQCNQESFAADCRRRPDCSDGRRPRRRRFRRTSRGDRGPAARCETLAMQIWPSVGSCRCYRLTARLDRGAMVGGLVTSFRARGLSGLPAIKTAQDLA